MIALEIENNIAAPVAWTTRNRISDGRPGDRPQASDPRVKTTNPRINIRPLPTYSETLPNIRRRLVSVTRYAVTTHWEYVTSTPKLGRDRGERDVYHIAVEDCHKNSGKNDKCHEPGIFCIRVTMAVRRETLALYHLIHPGL